MNYFTIGFRNILKNRRRSLATLISVGFGFASISLFAGYIHNVYADWPGRPSRESCWGT